jgi:MFS transporter, DHA1 family, multidrug resistance protein
LIACFYVAAKKTQLPLAVHLGLFWLLALSFGMQPVTTDLYLASLPTLASAFAVEQRVIESTLLVYLLSYAAVQLFIGPLADRHGRRPILLGALLLYCLASAVGFWANSLATLNIVRALQALGVCSAVIAARAIARDLLEPREGAALLAKVLTVMGCVALAAPISGGILLKYFGWQACFLAMAVYAAGVLLLAIKTLPETNRHLNATATQWRPLINNYWQIAQHKEFLGYASIAAAAYAALMIFFLKAPVILIKQLHLSPTQFGTAFALCTFGFISGTLIGRRLVVTQGLRFGLLTGTAFALAGGSALMLVQAASVHSVVSYLICQFIYMLGHGVVQPIAQAAAIGPFPEKAGAAGSVLGVLIHIGALSWVMLLSLVPVTLAWPLGIFGASVFLAIGTWWLGSTRTVAQTP